MAEIEAEVFRIMKAFVRELIKAYIQIGRSHIKGQSVSKERGLVVERRNDKVSVYTIFGDISFNRTYYYDKTKAYVYPLDEALRLDKRQRLAEAVAIKLVETAGQVSYTKSSSNVTNGELSRQTVKNKIH